MIIVPNSNNPIASPTVPDAVELSNAYDQTHRQLRGEGEQSTGENNYNPFQVKQPTQDDANQQHQANIQQYFSSVPVNKAPMDDHTPDKLDNMMQNFGGKDPLWGEIGDELVSTIESLHEDVQNGVLTEEQARSIYQRFGQDRFAPLAAKHYRGSPLEHVSHHSNHWDNPADFAKK